jgi:hypothetical protein
MAFPALLGAGFLARRYGMKAIGGRLGAGLLGGTALSSVGSRLSSGGDKKRRRRRARLTQSELMELTNIKNILGRTAAANALPYYLGRGR